MVSPQGNLSHAGVLKSKSVKVNQLGENCTQVEVASFFSRVKWCPDSACHGPGDTSVRNVGLMNIDHNHAE
jgi:hypothetical protein